MRRRGQPALLPLLTLPRQIKHLPLARVLNLRRQRLKGEVVGTLTARIPIRNPVTAGWALSTTASGDPDTQKHERRQDN